jgi:hypothetical protein
VTYIQRLLDSAAPAAAGARLPTVPATAASSPVMAVDQRLGVFPGLIEPIGPIPAMHDRPIAEDRRPASGSPVQGAETAAPSPAPRRAERPLSTERPEQHTQSTASPATAQAEMPASSPRVLRPVSPLQRLVERDPLPDRRASVAPPPSPSPAQPNPAPVPPEAPAVQPAMPVRPQLPTTPPPFYNPTEITPDQFQPAERQLDGRRRAESSSPPATPGVPQAPAPPVLPRPPADLTPTAPLQPAADAGPSPFARLPDVPPPPTRTVRGEPVQPAPERIIERIREVPVTPLAPPKAMTAAAQSVIGPLGQRHGGWQPRQEGF